MRESINKCVSWTAVILLCCAACIGCAANLTPKQKLEQALTTIHGTHAALLHDLLAARNAGLLSDADAIKVHDADLAYRAAVADGDDALASTQPVDYTTVTTDAAQAALDAMAALIPTGAK